MNDNATRIRTYKARRRSVGWRRLDVWLSPAAYAVLLDLCGRGDTYSAALERALLQFPGNSRVPKGWES